MVTVFDGYDPAGTCTHAELPALIAKVPAAQAEHAELPDEPLKVPGAQAVHPLVFGVTVVP